MLIPLVVFVLIFLVVWEIVTTLFEITGVPEYKARFQVLIMMTAIGYSSKESELILQHPIRRKIAMLVMVYAYISNLAMLTILINLSKTPVTLKIMLICFAVLFFICILLKNRVKIESRLKYYFMKSSWLSVNKSNVYYLLSKDNDHGLYNIYVNDTFKFTGQTLEKCPLKEIGIQVLSIDKGHKIELSPKADYIIEKGDNLLVYCRLSKIKECFNGINKGKVH